MVFKNINEKFMGYEFKRILKAKAKKQFDLGINKLSWHDFIVILCDEILR